MTRIGKWKIWHRRWRKAEDRREEMRKPVYCPLCGEKVKWTAEGSCIVEDGERRYLDESWMSDRAHQMVCGGRGATETVEVSLSREIGNWDKPGFGRGCGSGPQEKEEEDGKC
jgi:hypothetical protein